MTLEVSTPMSGDPGQRRLYFSCKCGMIAARNESEAGDIKTSDQPDAVKRPAQDETAEPRIFMSDMLDSPNWVGDPGNNRAQNSS